MSNTRGGRTFRSLLRSSGPVSHRAHIALSNREAPFNALGNGACSRLDDESSALVRNERSDYREKSRV